MSYEASVTLSRNRCINVYGESGTFAEVSFHYHMDGGCAFAAMTADQARELAHALLDAAQEAEPAKAVEVTA